MCTVTFLPVEAGGYWLGCNRDERPSRGTALAPAIYRLESGRFVAPRDPDGGGTWIATGSSGVTWCLLNGSRDGTDASATENAPSRGLLVWGLATRSGADEAAEVLQHRRDQGRLRENPFRLLVVEPGREGREARVHRLDWDGEQVRTEALAGPHLEVSHGADQAQAWQRRNESFEALAVGGMDTVRPRLEAWHASHFAAAAPGNDLSVCLHHEQAHTVSFTQVCCTGSAVEMVYQAGAPCQQAPRCRVPLERER